MEGGTMRKLFVVIVCVFFMVGCKDIFGPSKANIVIDGTLSINLTTYNCPIFQGWVKNIGEKTAYNCKVEIIVYSDTAKQHIIDTALGFPATLADIPAGTRVYFDAVCFNLNSIAQIIAYDTQITWLER
jgi:hypothetical protein